VERPLSLVLYRKTVSQTTMILMIQNNNDDSISRPKVQREAVKFGFGVLQWITAGGAQNVCRYCGSLSLRACMVNKDCGYDVEWVCLRLIQRLCDKIGLEFHDLTLNSEYFDFEVRLTNGLRVRLEAKCCLCPRGPLSGRVKFECHGEKQWQDHEDELILLFIAFPHSILLLHSSQLSEKQRNQGSLSSRMSVFDRKFGKFQLAPARFGHRIEELAQMFPQVVVQA
jgi:hypothetical protein